MSSDKRRHYDAQDIEIEDPMDFLDASEKEAYISARHERQAHRGNARVKVQENAFDRALSVLTKTGAVIIALLLLLIVWMMVLRPHFVTSRGISDMADAAVEDGNDAGTPGAAEGERVRTTTQLNLRNAPNTESSEIIVAVNQGTELVRTAEENGWSTVLYEGQTLYCVSSYLEAAD